MITRTQTVAPNHLQNRLGGKICSSRYSTWDHHHLLVRLPAIVTWDLCRWRTIDCTFKITTFKLPLFTFSENASFVGGRVHNFGEDDQLFPVFNFHNITNCTARELQLLNPYPLKSSLNWPKYAPKLAPDPTAPPPFFKSWIRPCGGMYISHSPV